MRSQVREVQFLMVTPGARIVARQAPLQPVTLATRVVLRVKPSRAGVIASARSLTVSYANPVGGGGGGGALSKYTYSSPIHFH